MNAALIFIHALTPLHAGTGQGIGVIDLPVAREKATNLPFLPGSTLKGTLRDQCEGHATHGAEYESIFGPKTVDDQNAYAGSALFTDQRLLCLPVRSLRGTFGWVSSPYILRRLLRDAGDAGIGGLPTTAPQPSAVEECCVTTESVLKLKHGTEHIVALEDLDLNPAYCAQTNEWATWIAGQVFPDEAEWQDIFRQRFCVVHDDLMNFLADTSTEETARNKLDDTTKTVEKGSLWYEESLPTETILSGLLVAVEVKATQQAVFAAARALTQKPLQLGGGASVGRGISRVLLHQVPPANGNG